MSRGAIFRTPTALRSLALFAWDGRDNEDVARTGQALTFVRNDPAWAMGTEGKLFRVQEDQPRFAYHKATGAYGMLIEPTAVTNACTQPKNFASWTVVNSPSRVAAACDLGVLKLDYLTDDSGSLQEYYSLAQTLAAAQYVVSLYISRGYTANSGQITLADVTPTTRLDAQINWTGDVPSLAMTTGTALQVEEVPNVLSPLGYKVYRISMLAVSASAGAGTLTVRPVKTAASTGQMYAGGVQVEQITTGQTGPRSYIHLASGVRAAETAYWSIAFAPVALTLYTSFVNLGVAEVAGTIIGLGHDGTGTQPNGSLVLNREIATGRFDAIYKSGGVSYTAQRSLTAPTYGQRVELRAVLRAGGGAAATATAPLTIGVSVNSAAETTADGGPPVVLDSAWGSSRLYAGVGSIPGFLLEALKVFPGALTMAECRSKW